MLPLHEFGDVEALLALYGMLATLMSGFSIATVHASVNCEDKAECSAVVASLQKTALILIGSVFLVLVISSRFLASQLHFSSAWLFVVLGVILFANTLQSFRMSYLQGQRMFPTMSIANIISSGGRLALAALGVWVGWHAFGAAVGILCALLISLAFTSWKTRHALTAHTQGLGKERVREELSLVGFFAISTIFVTILYNTDIIVVKRFFAPDVAGLYSGISTIANIVLFLTSSFAAVLLSSVKRSHNVDERRRAFMKAIKLIGGGGGVFTIVCLIFAAPITTLLMGSRYLGMAYLLPWLVTAFFFSSLANVCINFAIALRQKGLIPLALCVSFVLVTLIAFRHGSPLEIAQNYLIVNILAAIGTGIFISRHLIPEKT